MKILILISFVFSSLAIADEPVKVGLLLCQTGSCAEWGNAAIQGAQLAAEELKSTTPVEIIVEDSAEDNVNLSVLGYRNLRQRGIHYIIGPTWSGAGKAIAPIASKDKEVIMISPSLGVREFNEAGDNLFNIWPHDELNSLEMANFARKQGISKIAIFSAQQPWSEMQAEVFKNQFEIKGGKITLNFDINPAERSFRTEASKVAASDTEAVFFTSYAEQMGVTASFLDQAGFKGKKLSVLMYQTAIDTSRGALEKTYYAAYPPTAKDFVDKFKARYGTEPATSADKGYDAIKVLVQAIKAATPNDLGAAKNALLATKNFEGASGTITFLPDRSVSGIPSIFQVQGGKMGLPAR